MTLTSPALNRRAFLAGAAAAAGAATTALCLSADAASAAAGGARVIPGGALRLRPGPGPGMARLAPGLPRTPVWGYNGMVPGPALRLRQGEEARVRVDNGLDQPTSVHWHGLRIDNEMDGVAGVTQEAIPPGGAFDYAFTPPDAGTYWYHPHVNTSEQLARGLYGLLVVEEPEPPRVDRELPLLLDDWRLDEEGRIHEASLGGVADRAHAGRLGNVLSVNGGPAPDLDVQHGERLRLRLANVANARIFALDFGPMKPVLIALDGQPVRPAPLVENRVLLAPGQRADVMLDIDLEPGAEALVNAVDAKGAYPVARLRADRAHVLRESPLDAPMGLPANPLPVPEPAGALEVDLRMEGGAMGRLAGATFEGERMEVRALVERGMVWSFNGVAGMPEAPLARVARGRAVRVRMINDTVWPHAMHLHGHHFRRIRESAAGVSRGPWRDTELVGRGETAVIEFVADNPGRWVFHCHMIEHQAGGMLTWIEVT